jgi:hypothetical protein
MTEPTPDLAAALARAQGEFENPTKDRTNPHFRNKYATLDSMQTATRPILAKHGLSVVQLPTPAPSLITRLMHSSGQSVQSETPMPASLKPQEYGSALTYMRRYAYAAILNITADEDDDAEAASTAKPSRAAAAKMEPAAPAPGTSSGRDLATDWVDEIVAQYAAATTIEAVDALSEQANKVGGGHKSSRVDRLQTSYPDLHSRYMRARLEAEERVMPAMENAE